MELEILKLVVALFSGGFLTFVYNWWKASRQDIADVEVAKIGYSQEWAGRAFDSMEREVESLRESLKHRDEIHRLEVKDMERRLNEKTQQIENLMAQVGELYTDLANHKGQLAEYRGLLQAAGVPLPPSPTPEAESGGV